MAILQRDPHTVPQAPATHVVDVTEATFEVEVVQASFKVPVILDLWAEWCQPCKQLSPVLEALAAEGEGQWRLAKIDVDKAPQLAQYFGAQSIPMVVAIYQGQPIHEFAGALPKPKIQQWLKEIFKAVGLVLKGPIVEPPIPTEPAAAEAYFRKRLQARADDCKAKLGLGRLLLARGEVAEAEKMLDEIPGTAPEFNAARATLALKGLLAEVGAAGGETAVRERLASAPDDPEAAYLVALADATAGAYAKGLAPLIGLVQTQPEPLRARAKKACATLFEAAGRNDEAVEVLRRRLARLLF